MSIQIEDQQADLTLLHYDHADEHTDDNVKQTRGVIYKDSEVVCTSFSYTPEYTTEQADSYRPLLTDIEKCTIFKSEEGSLLRLFFEEGRCMLFASYIFHVYDVHLLLCF